MGVFLDLLGSFKEGGDKKCDCWMGLSIFLGALGRMGLLTYGVRLYMKSLYLVMLKQKEVPTLMIYIYIGTPTQPKRDDTLFTVSMLSRHLPSPLQTAADALVGPFFPFLTPLSVTPACIPP